MKVISAPTSTALTHRSIASSKPSSSLDSVRAITTQSVPAQASRAALTLESQSCWETTGWLTLPSTFPAPRRGRHVGPEASGTAQVGRVLEGYGSGAGLG